MLADFLWVGLPYIAFTFLVIGSLVRYLFFERTWTTKSSEFLAKQSLRWAGPLFHVGLFLVLVGHISGILIPKSVTTALGITEHMYHMGAVYGGLVGGTLLVVSFFALMLRRLNQATLKVNTSTMDWILFALLALTIITGYLGAIGQNVHPYDYRTTIAPWFRGLLYWQPDPSLMKHVPLVFKLHMLCWMGVAIVFPFTRLVHCLSFPFSYLQRKAIIYRKK